MAQRQLPGRELEFALAAAPPAKAFHQNRRHWRRRGDCIGVLIESRRLRWREAKGAACVELTIEGDEFFDESNTEGYPGESVDEATHRTPGSYGDAVMEMRLRRAHRFGRNSPSCRRLG